MDPFFTHEIGSCVVELHVDEEPLSPAEWDTLGVVYALNHGAEYQGFESIAQSHGNAIEANERGGARLLVRYLRLCHGIYAVPFDLNDYGSSGVQLSRFLDDETDPVDAYIATTHERVTELCGEGANYHEPEWIIDALRSELGEWRSWFDGEVVGYVVRCQGAVVGSCWGFYPDSEPSDPYTNGRANTDAYVVAWDVIPDHVREHVYALAEGVEAAMQENAERQSAEAQGIPTA